MNRSTRNCIVLRPHSRLAMVLLTTALVGCGARPGMDSDPDALVNANAPQPDAVAPGPDVAVDPVACHWVAGARHRITDPPNDKGIHDLEITEDGALIAYQCTNPDPPADNHRYVQHVDWQGVPIGDPAAVFAPPNQYTSYSSVSLGTGSNHRGAVVWEANVGCRFRRVDAGGVALGSESVIDPERCGSLRPTTDGFSLFTTADYSGNRRLLRLGETGALQHVSEPIEALDTEGYWWATLALPGGDLLVGAIRDESEPMPIVTQRIDAWGAAQTDTTVITTAHDDARRLRLVHTGNGVLAGWQSAEPPTPSDQVRFLTLQRLDEQGQALSSPSQAADVQMYRDSGWSMVRRGDQVLAAVVQPAAYDDHGDDTVLTLLVFGLDGTLLEEPLHLTRIRFARHPRIRATPTGVLVGFQGMDEATPPHQVFTVTARCE